MKNISLIQNCSLQLLPTFPNYIDTAGCALISNIICIKGECTVSEKFADSECCNCL